MKKKLICLTLCLLMMATMVIPAAAISPWVVFTGASRFEVGRTVSVDIEKTFESIRDHGTSDMYNAYLEGFRKFVWYKNNTLFAQGTSCTLTAAEGGATVYCRVVLFEDAEMTQICGHADSPKEIVLQKPAPEITTKSLPNGTQGVAYYQKLQCTDPDVSYSLFRSSLPDGLNLTQHGEIEGTPTKAGFWYVVIMVTNEFGEENTAEFEFTIDEPAAEDAYTMEIQKVPDKVVYKQGEKLDMTGLRVRIWTPEGYIDSKDGKYLTYSSKELVTLGEQKIKLTYKTAVDFFIVTVVPADPEQTTEETTEATTTDITSEKTTEPVTTPTTQNPVITDGAVGITTNSGGGLSVNWGIILALAAAVLLAVLLVLILMIVLIVLIIKKAKKKKNAK